MVCSSGISSKWPYLSLVGELSRFRKNGWRMGMGESWRTSKSSSSSLSSVPKFLRRWCSTGPGVFWGSSFKLKILRFVSAKGPLPPGPDHPDHPDHPAVTVTWSGEGSLVAKSLV